MAEVTCTCVSKKCNHPSGEPCGAPVENPLEVLSFDANKEENPVGPWVKRGICEACWKTNESLYKTKPRRR